jgi:hypothetical protein
MSEHLGEAYAMELFCTELPGLRERARPRGSDEPGWQDRLERAVSRVRAGGSAVDACQQFRSVKRSDRTPEDPTRGDGSYVGLDGWLEPVRPAGRGNYRCPRRLCSRQAERDAYGHPPVCAVFDDEPMQPEP